MRKPTTFGPELFNQIAVSKNGLPFDKVYANGIPFDWIIENNGLGQEIKTADYICCHNIYFDLPILRYELYVNHFDELLNKLIIIPVIDSMIIGETICKLPRKCGKGYKSPILSELYHELYGSNPNNVHDSLSDVDTLIKCVNHSRLLNYNYNPMPIPIEILS